MKAVLLGGSGFIGAHLSKALVDAGNDVIVFDRLLPVLAPQWDGVRYVLGDLTALGSMDLVETLRHADLVFYLAWRFTHADSNRNMALDIEANLIGAIRVLESCVAAGVGRVIFYSSGGTVYGQAQYLPIAETHPTEPRSSHAILKLSVEKYLALFDQTHGLDYVVLRPGNPFGRYQNPASGQGVIAALHARMASGEPFEVWGDGAVVRDYFHVSDLVRASLLAGTTSHSRTVYNVGSGTGRSLREVIETIQQMTGRKILVRWGPGRDSDVPSSILNIEKAQRLLRWSPRLSFEEGLRLTFG